MNLIVNNLKLKLIEKKIKLIFFTNVPLSLKYEETIPIAEAYVN